MTHYTMIIVLVWLFLLGVSSAAYAADIVIIGADNVVRITPTPAPIDVYDSLEAPPQSYSQIYIGFADSVVNRELFSPEISATVDIDPDTLNLKDKEDHNEKECKHERDDEKCENGDHKEVHEGRWITAYIELPEGYDVNDINVSTVRLNDTIAAEQHPAEVGDHDEDGIPDLMVKFDRRAVIYIISGNATGEVELTVTGNLYSGISFRGSDTIRVIKKEEKLKDKNEKQECKYESSDEDGSKDKKCKHGDEKHREGSDKEKEGQHEE